MGRRRNPELVLDPSVWRLDSSSTPAMYSCMVCNSRPMVEKSVYKHVRYEKHTSALSAFYAARESGERVTVLDPRNDYLIGDSQAITPEVYEDAETTAAWCPWEGIENEPDVHARQEESDGTNDRLDFSSDSRSESIRSGYASESELSDYDSNNEADDEEWDLPNHPSFAEPDESYAANPTGVSNDEEAARRRYARGNNPWWPYKSKEYLVASLLIGYTHHMVSRAFYAHIRLMFKFYNITLPDWTTVRREKKRTRSLLDFDVLPSVSIFGTPTYRLSLPKVLAQEVANPHVSPVIDYYPQEANGQHVYKLSQSVKWLADLDPACRAPMYRSSGHDWYLYEPVQLKNDEVVIPLFFFQMAGEMHSKCAVPHYEPVGDGSQLRLTFPAGIPFGCSSLRTVKVSEFDYDYSEITDAAGELLATRCRESIYELGELQTTWHHLPNPWRTKANGRVIRHLPINLYSDDTSGNQSKRWNKHISYYFTLSGLPPRWTNQNYNCHYLTTSNIAGAMELAAPIVSDLRMLASEGYPAFDCTLQEEVLLVSHILCFLGDSPMHAEITSTPNPGNSLHPCRACALSAASVRAKATLDYVRFFFMIGPTGSWIKHPPRLWEQIKSQCYKVWDMAKKPRTKTAVGNSSSTHGVKDMINRAVIDQRYEVLESGHDPTDSERQFLEKINQIDRFDPGELFNPYFEAPGFDGCRDTPVEILHVFLLGVVKYMVRDFMRHLSAEEKLQVKARYQTFNIDGLNIPSIQASYLTNHFANFIGKDFRIVLQAAPFVLFEYMDDRERTLLSASG
ncbi:uncharacterized protein PGTG_10380 [Puccinia graminis f. sp. tritici CRL 75-36-700-3]|uniref:C2H2-type domain-containing protein n=1 Tax=Puccinia graminis f. sp. tritici (strain CRL 75-36-700-3 / race SCCL) TaxID=418459 RepID=E3KKT4_PUCGT|nr:uncharacterized protein PGTG_10380 [Puccinia graminis f. sp. tritici CRL 75-36-700-3]EFP84909.2 hypothetical protein PGTG_10380 [Puccinia graminis f. sp. tritici CRL 75-36-700-3]